MAEISSYGVAVNPKLADKLIGTSVNVDPENVTYNFTIQQLLNLLNIALPSYANTTAAKAAGKAVGSLYINTTDHTVAVVY